MPTFGNSKFDSRTLKRALREGKITQKELDQHLKSLPDEKNRAQEIAVFEEQDNSNSSDEPTFSPANRS